MVRLIFRISSINQHLGEIGKILSVNRLRKIGDKSNDVLRKIYTADTQYLAFPKTTQGRRGWDTSMRRRAGMDSWEMLEKDSLYLIYCIIISKTQIKN